MYFYYVSIFCSVRVNGRRKQFHIGLAAGIERLKRGVGMGIVLLSPGGVWEGNGVVPLLRICF